MLQEVVVTNSNLSPRDQRVSTQLYCTLEGSAQRLLEHAGDGEGSLSWRRLVAEYERETVERRHCCSRFLRRLLERHVWVSLDEFGMKIRRYERTCGESGDLRRRERH